ncbi:MAG: glycosyltransferase family 2 protein [Phyllobacterium sp.]|uniref:glycosyltransferase family 2 protein n=1 Tax=Phyllobacterium sp. TaxID=1871046 RepID=UPI0030F22B3F
MIGASMVLKYPVEDNADWRQQARIPIVRKLKSHYRHAKSRFVPRSNDPRLRRHSGNHTPLSKDDIPAICVVRNALLRYYRSLGVTRFIIIDDRSVDGTTAALSNLPDVDLFTSHFEYKDTDRGKDWRDAFFDMYGRNRWYLSLDADEFLIFPGSETRSIRGFIADLERAGISRAHCPMIDIYPPGPLSSGVFVDDGTSWPFEVSSHFDGDGYTVKQERYGSALRGGPRQRLFGRDMRLSKFPLLWVDDATSYRLGSIHGPAPSTRNFVPVTGVLLHYRFSSHSIDEFRRIVEVAGMLMVAHIIAPSSPLRDFPRNGLLPVS